MFYLINLTSFSATLYFSSSPFQFGPRPKSLTHRNCLTSCKFAISWTLPATGGSIFPQYGPNKLIHLLKHNDPQNKHFFVVIYEDTFDLHTNCHKRLL